MDLTSIEVDEEEVTSFFNSLTLQKVLVAALVLLVCLVIIKILLRWFDRGLERSRIEKSLHGFLRTMTRAVLYVLAILIALDQLGVEVSSLVALVSVAALAVSLALQDILSNVASGLVILSSHPFRVSDFVEIDSVSGTVKEISLTYTQIATIDNKLVFVPNSSVTASNIINYTTEERRRVDISITASYDSPLQAVKDALLRAAASQGEKILEDPAPVALVTAYQESDIQYCLRAWVMTPDYWDVYFALLEQIKMEFDSAGVEMTYPHMNVHIAEK